MSRYETAAPEGQPTHVPAVRINGVETGSDRYNALLGKYQGALAQFQLGQQQQVAISGQRYYKASRTMPGARMTYQNNDGQETITLELTPHGEEEKVEETKDEFWDWALIELTINDIKKTRPIFGAFVTVPKHIPLTSDVLPQKGVAEDDGLNSPDDVPHQIVMYAGDTNILFANGGTPFTGEPKQVSSLRVDLRQYNRAGPMHVELWGWVPPFERHGLPEDPTAVYTILGVAYSVDRQRIYRNDDTQYDIDCTADEFAQAMLAFPEFDDGSTIRRTGSYTLPAGYEDAGLVFTPIGIYGENPAYNASWKLISGSWAKTGGLGSGGTDYPGWSDLDQTGTPLTVADPNLWTATFANTAYTTTQTYWDLALTIPRLQTFSGTEWDNPTVPTSTHETGNVISTAGNPDGGNYPIEAHDSQVLNIPEIEVYQDFKADITFVMLKGGDPIDRCTEHYYTSDSDDGPAYYQFEGSKKYPDRWKMGKAPVQATVKSFDRVGSTTSIANHFGLQLMGTLVIDPRLGTVGFKPA